MDRFTDRTALITGGGSGIGRATALRLASAASAAEAAATPASAVRSRRLERSWPTFERREALSEERLREAEAAEASGRGGAGAGAVAETAAARAAAEGGGPSFFPRERLSSSRFSLASRASSFSACDCVSDKETKRFLKKKKGRRRKVARRW